MTPAMDRDRRISSETVWRFDNALRIALCDKRLEVTKPITFYYDADVVLRMILGFQQFRYDIHPVRDERILLVRALLCSGYLGEVHLLRPHALEIDEVLHSKFARVREGNTEDLERDLGDFLDEWHVRATFDVLHQAIEQTPLESRVDRFYEELKEVGHESFTPIELANGDWRQRLARFARDQLIKFTDPAPSLRLTLKDPVLWEIRDIIAKARKGKKELSHSILRDATALALLHQQIRNREEGRDLPLVRFYSETEVLRGAWQRNRRLKELLSYKPGGEFAETGEELRFCFRDADYFIVRASFEELRFPKLKTSRPAASEVSLENLEAVTRELGAVLKEQGTLDNIYLENAPLKDYIEQFESLSFLRSFWVRYKPPKAMNKFVAGLAEVWAFAREGPTGEAVRNRIAREIKEVQKELRSTVQDLRDRYQLFYSIQKFSDEFLRGKTKFFRSPDPIKDLGLIRWGIELPPESIEQFNALMAMLLADEDEKWWRGCAELTDLVRSIDHNFDQCALACAALWSLRNFTTIVAALDQYNRSAGALPTSFLLLRAAANLHAKNLPFNVKSELLAETTQLIDQLSTKVRPKFLIGLGYLYFHSWEPEKHRDYSKNPQANAIKAQLDTWLETSFRLGEEAVETLESFTLYWAFAVNHCTYVGSVGELGGQRINPYLNRLIKLENHRELWNYRFADTLAYYYYLMAKNLFEESGKPANQLTSQDRQIIHANLKSAFDVYARARDYFGDMEIPTHLNEINTFCAQVGYGGAPEKIRPHRIPPDPYDII